MHKPMVTLIIVLSCFTTAHAQTNGLANLIAAEQAIQANKAEEIRLITTEKARLARIAKANRIAAAKRAAAAKLYKNSLASNRVAITEAERLQDRELEMLVKRAEAETKIATLQARGSLANANARADLDAKVQRTEASTDSIRANNDAKRLIAEGSKQQLLLEGKSRVINAASSTKKDTLKQ